MSVTVDNHESNTSQCVNIIGALEKCQIILRRRIPSQGNLFEPCLTAQKMKSPVKTFSGSNFQRDTKWRVSLLLIDGVAAVNHARRMKGHRTKNRPIPDRCVYYRLYSLSI